MTQLKLGVIADDYTGATDIAVTLTKEGMRVVQTIGAPNPDAVPELVDALVVALKSRTIPAQDAVSLSLEALGSLQQLGAKQIFFKYCSTFDSSHEGNIGPVGDTLLDALGGDLAFICPAFPANARSVYAGHLFVGHELLSESPMRDHPLTPMRDSNLMRLMDAQSRHKAGLIPHAIVARGAAAIEDAAGALKSQGYRYAVVDAITDADLRTIGQAAQTMPLVTGGSGVALGLPANFGVTPQVEANWPAVAGRSVILAGSCSTATRAQIAFAARENTTLKLDPHRIANGEPVAEDAIRWASETSGAPLIFASSDPSEVALVQEQYGREKAGHMIEDTFSQIALGLSRDGFSRFVVAGGETSGAVINGLGISTLNIFDEIDPGVPWTATPDNAFAVALKSGNFGGEDFFEKALGVLP